MDDPLTNEEQAQTSLYFDAIWWKSDRKLVLFWIAGLFGKIYQTRVSRICLENQMFNMSIIPGKNITIQFNSN